MNLNELRKRLILSLKNKEPDVRKIAVLELSNSDIPDRYRILENWAKYEKIPSILMQIEEILQNADWFDESASIKIRSNLDQEQRKILDNLRSGNLEKVKKTFTFLLKNRRLDFLSSMLEVEKQFDDSYLKICNIRLLHNLGPNSLQTLKAYLEFPDREVQRIALEAVANIKTHQAISCCLLESYRLGPNFIESIVKHLSKWNLNIVLEVLQELTEDLDPCIRLSVAFWCRKVPHKISFNCCQVLIGDDDRSVVQMAWDSIEVLSQKLEEAKQILSKIGSKNKVNGLMEKRKRVHLEEDNLYSFDTLFEEYQLGDLRQKASSIQKIGFLESANDSIIKFLKDCTYDEDSRIRANALEALDQLQSKTDQKVLLRCLEDGHNRVIGNACVALYSNYREEFFSQIYRAMSNLGNSNNEASRLTLVFCVDQTRDERFLPLIRSQFKQQKFDLVRERSLQLLEDWSEDSPSVLYELEEWKRSFQIELDQEEPLDEFLD